jgi:hypothetical protein
MLAAKFCAPQYGRPSLTPGIYFRSLLIGYFEGKRRLIDVDTHREVFSWVLGMLGDRGLLKGKRIRSLR